MPITLNLCWQNRLLRIFFFVIIDLCNLKPVFECAKLQQKLLWKKEAHQLDKELANVFQV